jgi:hypothetical protein
MQEAPQGRPHRRNWWKIMFLTAAGFFVLLIGGCMVVGLVALSGTGGGGPNGSGAGSGPNGSGEKGAGTTEIRLGGTEGIPVSCSIEDAGGGRSVDTRVPDTIKVEADLGTIVVAVCQKSGTDGTLRAAIVVDDEVVSQQETSAAYGTVSISHPN